jgi:lipid-A-disaccharide synthase
MGFVEVLFNLKTILGNIKICKMIFEFKPDVIIFIDYPGFNMRIAKAKEKSIPTHYYISPQIWA